MADLLMINGHPQQSCPILGVRQICAGFGSRLQPPKQVTDPVLEGDIFLAIDGAGGLFHRLPIAEQ